MKNKHRDRDRLLPIVTRARERSLRRLGKYSDTNLDWFEHLTGEAEDTEWCLSLMLRDLITEEEMLWARVNEERRLRVVDSARGDSARDSASD